MKIKQPTGKTLGETLETGAGVIGGAKLSEGITELIPIDNKTFAKAGALIVGALLASSIRGTDTLSKLAKNASIGMLVQQGGELINEVVQPMLPQATNGGTKFLNDVFGGAKAIPLAQAGTLGFTQDAFLANPAAMRQPVGQITPLDIQGEESFDFATA